MEIRHLFYIKPIMSLDLKRRYLRLTPDEAEDKLSTKWYRVNSGEIKSIVKIEVNSPGQKEIIVILIEHADIQKKTASDIHKDWTEWRNEMVWQAGIDDLEFNAGKLINC